MFINTITPRFCDTDAQGHINNTVFPVWLLEGRQIIVEMHSPNLALASSGLALVRQEIDYKNECFFGDAVEVKTSITKLGNSSIHIAQEIWQTHKQCVQAHAILVCFDRKERTSHAIPPALREQLQEHLEQ